MAEAKRATVDVASRIHTAIRIDADAPDGRVVTLAGSPQGELGEEVVTQGVDKESFDRWMAEHEGSPLVERVRVMTTKDAPKNEIDPEKTVPAITKTGLATETKKN